MIEYRLVKVEDFDEAQVIITHWTQSQLEENYDKVLQDPAQDLTLSEIVTALSDQAEHGSRSHLVDAYPEIVTALSDQAEHGSRSHLVDAYPKLAKICEEHAGARAAKRIFLDIVKMGGMDEE